jgi:hypothetical protein
MRRDTMLQGFLLHLERVHQGLFQAMREAPL